MLSGLQELFILVILVLIIIFIPRFFNNYNRRIILRSPPLKQIKSTWKLRSFIVGSFLWLIAFAIYIKPWEDMDTLILYIIIGIGPISLFWSICWIKDGSG